MFDIDFNSDILTSPLQEKVVRHIISALSLTKSAPSSFP